MMTNFSNHRLINRLFFVLLGLTVLALTSCQSNKPATPTPLAAATSQPSHTPTPMIVVTETPRNVETAVPTTLPSPTNTQTPTPTTQPTRTPGPPPTKTPIPLSFDSYGISSWSLNAQGQLALLKNGSLLVEVPPMSGIFHEVDQSVVNAFWSPDGEKIFYAVQPVVDEIYDFKIFELQSLESFSISNIIHDFPTSPYGQGSHFLAWESDSSGILFLRENSREESQLGGELYAGELFLLDLEQNNYTQLMEIFEIYKIKIPVANENTFFAFFHCGAPCEFVEKFDYSGHEIWRIPFPTGGRVVFSKNADFVINYGCADGCPLDDPVNISIQQFDTHTGEVLTIWQIYENEHFNGLQIPELSPDEKYLGFYLENDDFFTILQIIDLTGRSYGQRPNSVIVDWRPGGGPVVQERVAVGQTQLLYWPLDGTPVQVFAELGLVDFAAGKWSEDGRFFIYSTVDEANNQSQLTLWQPEASQPTLLTTAEGTDGFQNFAWLLDGTAVYFNFGRTELWKYEVATNALTLIASTEPSE